MGWTYGWSKRRDLIDDITAGWINDGKRVECLKQCYRGNAYSGILWTVWVVSNADKSEVLDTYIGCARLRCSNSLHGREWGYKQMTEHEGPCFYSCPLGYLEMTPEPEEGYSKDWRIKVRAYHAKRNRKLDVGATYCAAAGVSIKKRKISRIRVDSLRPNKGTVFFEDGGTRSNVKFSVSHLAEKSENVRPVGTPA